MINGARAFPLGLGTLLLALSLAAPVYARPSPSAFGSGNEPLGDTLRFLSAPPKAERRRVIRHETVTWRRPAPFLLVPVLGPFGLAYVRVPAYPVVYPPPLMFQFPVVATYPYRPVFAYQPMFVPAYAYGRPVY